MTTAEVDATPGDCESLQQEEYEVLESIYPECISSEMKNKSLRLEIPVEFGTPRTVHVEEDQSDIQTNSAAAPPIALSLSSLPPVTLNVVLPALYPIKNPPTLTSIRAAHFWLPQIPRLHQALTDLWEPGEGVLYNWIEFLRSGEFLDTLSLLDDNNDIRIIHPSPPILTKVLKESDASSSFLRFTHNSYPCSICLSTVRGSKCVQLSCTHIFCRPCLEDFWKLCIEEGDVGRVGCPDLACVKDGREADAEEVARVVTQDCMERWRSLKIKRNLERDPSVIHCPMAFCQTPVLKPTGVEEGTGWEYLRSCPGCSFSFCALCRRTWHGPITPCRIAHSEKLVLEYLSTKEGSREREAMEKRYGRRNVLRLVGEYEEEQANKSWKEASTMACPGCSVHVEKSAGCNHMTCAKCGQHFCYRCGAKIKALNPYVHFSTAGERCYNKLFDFERDEEMFE
ncbi:hypothetical protein C0989_011083 [Termitomyces sp. Mn162]|nr:hypothetical protein C0989_011083 [Termitomyces sp. Mn162]KAH0590437.1 hypothetical protein H2248_000587 [Termitomyces sp. 'cryptogamus']